jgi:predicted transcriptional regulator of viral defense system
MSSQRHVLTQLARATSGGLLSVKRAAEVMGVSTHEAAARLGRLARSGWLARARRGLYLVLPLEASAENAPIAEDSWLLAMELFAPCYIGGWTAAEHWGLTEQLFRSTFVVSAAQRRRQSERRLSTEFHIVRVGAHRMKGTTFVWRGEQRVAISDRELTIIDALIHPHWIGGVRHLTDILEAYRSSKDFDSKLLIARAEEHATGSAFKRLGYLVERLWPNEKAIIDLAHSRRTKGVIRLDPSVKGRGKMNKRWGLWINVAIEGASIGS